MIFGRVWDDGSVFGCVRRGWVTMAMGPFSVYLGFGQFWKAVWLRGTDERDGRGW